MSLWPHVNKEHPCPICRKDDWCTVGERAILCQRIQSPHPHRSGNGWYHFFDGPRPKFQAKAPPPVHRIDAASIMLSLPSGFQYELAQSLGVSVESLMSLGCRFAPAKSAHAFPMSDGQGSTIGIRLRNDAGMKWAWPGSKQGIFLPTMVPDRARIEYGAFERAYLPEGPTDTAALLSMGLCAIGRPTCNFNGEYIREALQRLGIKEIYPGIEGAYKLKKELGVRSVVWMPPSPVKDAREFYRRGGTRQLIESDIKNKVWSRC